MKRTAQSGEQGDISAISCSLILNVKITLIQNFIVEIKLTIPVKSPTIYTVMQYEYN